MSYHLGIDLGTTYSAAAVWRSERAHIANLGSRTPTIPSVVLLRDDGELLVGEAAERRAVVEPQRIAREFKRRIGDPTPVIIGGAPYSADALTARLLRSVVDSVVHYEGSPPDGIVVAHPANWGVYKQDLLLHAIELADLDRVTTVSEPEAAAIHYAFQERVSVGANVAVYDLGGGTFDAAVLHRTDTSWERLGEPEGIEHLGGVDFDEAIFQHVRAAVGDGFDGLDPDDPPTRVAVARLRQECVQAKEALTYDTVVSIPVLLPTTQMEVRLTRTEFEDMIRPALVDSIAATKRAIRSANLSYEQVSTVLLVGGSSRIPLVAQLVESEIGRPVAIDAHPKHVVALGSAITAAERSRVGHAGHVDPAPTPPSLELPALLPDSVGAVGGPPLQPAAVSDPEPVARSGAHPRLPDRSLREGRRPAQPPPAAAVAASTEVHYPSAGVLMGSLMAVALLAVMTFVVLRSDNDADARLNDPTADTAGITGTGAVRAEDEHDDHITTTTTLPPIIGPGAPTDSSVPLTTAETRPRSTSTTTAPPPPSTEPPPPSTQPPPPSTEPPPSTQPPPSSSTTTLP